MIDQTIGHYRIVDRLGAGGMGEVHLAEDTTLHRKVALKVLPAELAPRPERMERFEREAQTLAALDHPNIVTIYSVEEADGIRFLTMAYVEGRTLAEMILPEGLPVDRWIELAEALAEGLQAAHAAGQTTTSTSTPINARRMVPPPSGRVRVDRPNHFRSQTLTYLLVRLCGFHGFKAVANRFSSRRASSKSARLNMCGTCVPPV